MKEIKISVVLPVYNGGEYLKLSIGSVLAQTMRSFELLILDDCSTDGSYEWLQQIKDDRVQVFKNEKNSGLFPNLNTLIKKSVAPLIKLWSQDDIMYPYCLEKVILFHEQHANIGFSYTGRTIINEGGIITNDDNTDSTPCIISTELHSKIAYFTGSIAGNIANVCITKKALDKVGLFKEHMKISGDFDMWVRLAKEYQTGFIKENLIQLRNHSGQLSRNESLFIYHLREDLEVYRFLNGYTPVTIQNECKQLMRSNKLAFYYTLMIKAFFKGHLKTVLKFYKELSGYDNFILLTLSFIKTKLIKPKKPVFNH